MSIVTSSPSMITGDAFEAVEFMSDSDTDSWQVVDDPFFDSENDDVITTESDVITSSDEDEDDDEVDEIINHTQELIDQKAAVELHSSIDGQGDQYMELPDLVKEDMYYMLTQRALGDVEEEDVDEDEDDYDEDLDDELVPRWLNNKFERQRMRKLGKKVYPKMKKSKRVVNQYNRPGCAGAKFQMW